MGDLIQVDFGFSLKKFLDDAHLSRNSERCGQCNNTISWSENQFKKHCSKCGAVVIRSSEIPKQTTKCWICFDSGLVEYDSYMDGLVYHFGAACVCEKGQNYLCESVPRIDQVLMAPPVSAILQRNKEICKVI